MSDRCTHCDAAYSSALWEREEGFCARCLVDLDDEVTFTARDLRDQERKMPVDGVVYAVDAVRVWVRVGGAGRMVVARASITSVRRPA